MILYPAAKINIGLNILSKREDGYHQICSILKPIQLCDILEIQVSDFNSFTYSGIPIPASTKPNLIEQVWEIMQSKYQLSGIKAHLHKIIPPGSGLGGGSADAASFIHGVNQLLNLNLTLNQKLEIALSVGSDTAFSIINSTCLVEGRGDVLKEFQLVVKDLYFVLFMPDIHIDTKWAFSTLQLPFPKQEINKLNEIPIENWKNSIRNDFEISVYKNFPALKELQNWLYQNGAIYAQLNGSGSSVYGFFRSEPSNNNYPKNTRVWISKLT